MKLLTDDQYKQLIANGTDGQRGKNHFPVVKLFVPGMGCTWLLTELDPETPSLAFGLCDLGMGFPELGYCDLDEIPRVKSPMGLNVERDMHFDAKFPISVYARAASAQQQITESYYLLSRYTDHKQNNPSPQ